MSIDSIVSDIKDNVENINYAAENIQPVVINKAEFISKKITISKVPEETINKLNTFLNLIIIRDNINNNNKVAYNMATEVFTMIPNVDNKEVAKLTSAPSSLNKEILKNIIDREIEINSNSVLSSIVSTGSCFYDDIELINDKLNRAINYLQSFIDIISSMDNDPILLYNNNNNYEKINLLKASLSDISKLFLEVNEQKVSLLAYYIINNKNYKTLLNILNIDINNINKQSFVTLLYSIKDLYNALLRVKNEYLPNLKNLIDNLNINIIRNRIIDKDVNDIIMQYNDFIKFVDILNSLDDIINNEDDNIFENIIKYKNSVIKI